MDLLYSAECGVTKMRNVFDEGRNGESSKLQKDIEKVRNAECQKCGMI